MSTDFRALCAELLDDLEGWVAYGEIERIEVSHALIDRAREILAQPEPEFTAEEVEMIQAPWSYLAPAQPEPAAPTDDEIDALVICIQALPAPSADDLALQSIDQGRGMVRQALARFGRLTLNPIPVSKRLPGAEDCDAHGWCWVLYTSYGTWTLEPPLDRNRQPCGWTHWLPFHALPLPTSCTS
jgi:hypothetical protein